tara:strand:+ start:94 stop:1038 length:945 start_codon:yes stop_codon:yes gene_type:complete
MYQDIENRLKKRLKQLLPWTKQQIITCYRIYDNDIPEHPFILDWYESVAILWFFPDKYNKTIVTSTEYETKITSIICNLLHISSSQLFIKYRSKQKGLAQQYKKLTHTNKTITVHENNLNFEINCSDYLDTGLFLDHRNTRRYVQQIARNKRVLNLFSYTGSFTCYALAGGASATTTVDLNPRYIDWTKRNLALNNIKVRSTDNIICDNVLSFIKHEAAHRKYDIIICDPPTFSNSKKMKHSFNINSDYPELLNACLKCLAKNGELIFSTNSRSFKLDISQFPSSIAANELTKKTIPLDFKNKQSHRCWVLSKK